MSRTGIVTSSRVNSSAVRNKKQKSFFDYSLLFMMIFIICFGLVVLYSASTYECQMKYGDPKYYLMQQIKALIMGFVAMGIIVYFVNYRILKFNLFAIGIYIISMFIAMLVLTPLGVEANGAKRWISVVMSVQVCEIVKVGLIIFMAYYLNKYGSKIKDVVSFIKALGCVALPAGVIAVFTSDLSSAIVIAGIGSVMIFITCPKIKYFLILLGMGVGLVAVAILAMPYRMKRVRVWLNPKKYGEDGGYQVLQSLYSLASGGLFGKGLGKGVQKLGYVPEAQNDMIFTVICEELGIIGGIAVIFMFVFMIYRLWVVSVNAPDLFGSLLVIGVMAHISIQTIINIAVVTNTMPNTGVPLPFLSYGGTSILCLLLEMALVFSVSKRTGVTK